MNGHHYAPDRPLVVPPMQHQEPVQFAGEVRRLRLGPADRLVMKVDAHLSVDISERLQRLLGGACGIDPGRVIVIGLGMDLSVIGPEGVAE